MEKSASINDMLDSMKASKPRTPINAERAFDLGYNRWPQRLDTGEGQASAVKQSFWHYYRAGWYCHHHGISRVKGYYRAAEGIGLNSSHKSATEIQAIMGPVQESKEITPPQIAEQDSKALEWRKTWDCNTAFVRAWGYNANLGVAIFPTGDNEPSDAATNGLTSFCFTQLDEIRALRAACDFVIAKAVEHRLKEAPKEGPQEDSVALTGTQHVRYAPR